MVCHFNGPDIPRKVSRWHLNQMPKPPKLAPFYVCLACNCCRTQQEWKYYGLVLQRFWYVLWLHKGHLQAKYLGVLCADLCICVVVTLQVNSCVCGALLLSKGVSTKVCHKTVGNKKMPLCG